MLSTATDRVRYSAVAAAVRNSIGLCFVLLGPAGLGAGNCLSLII